MSGLLSLEARAYQQCIPLHVTFEITLRCNLRCVHCYNFDRDLPYLPGRGREQELSDAEIHRIIEEVREEGCLFLAFSGGEALVHPRIDHFIRHACGLGMDVRLKSNGTLLSRETVQRVAEAGASSVDISLYGADAATHDDFVKWTGAFQRTLEGAEAARDAGLATRFSFILLQRNAEQIPEMIRMSEAMGIPYSLDPQVTARYDGSRSSLDARADRSTLERLYRGPLRPLISTAPNESPSVQCSCARSVCGITAFGEVYPCMGAPLLSGNLRTHSFHEIWRNSPTFQWIRGLGADDFATCRDCLHRPFCRRSSGAIYTNTGHYTGPEEFGGDWTCMEAEVIHALHDEGVAREPAGDSMGSMRRHSAPPPAPAADQTAGSAADAAGRQYPAASSGRQD